jgi:glycosyltransferase involved in cell wall biosynthesis
VLVMIGDGPLRHELAETVRRRGLEPTVRLLGLCPRERVWEWQCAADVLVNSSRSEGTPLAPLEALGAGTPVVAYDVGGIAASLAAVSGGRVAAERTSRALAEAVAAELAAPRDRARLAREARAQFDIARTCDAIEQVYAEVA